MKKNRFSLKMGLLTTIIICWLVPILIIVTLAGVIFDTSYRNRIQREVEVSVANAMQQVQMHLENAIRDSKAVSYDGIIRDAYRSYQTTADRVELYRQTNDYLNQSFAREEQYKATFIRFWDQEADVSAYHLSRGTTGYELLYQCYRNTPEILEEMAQADTDIRFLAMDGELYMARNLLDSTFTPYASVVMLLDPQTFFQPLTVISRLQTLQITLDGEAFCLSGQGITQVQENENWNMEQSIQTDGHTLSFSAQMMEYDLWMENPWLVWAVFAVALMVLPLLAVIVALFYHHITRPIETLAQANLLVQSGQRGYEITQTPPNTEFEKLYDHFNAMSTELQNQFQRSYLEQQATQKAQIKALQSQINPHFLNNTLEVINWEARMAGNERISAMLEALSTMLGAALDRDGRNQIPLKEELSYVDAYLYIIRERLGEQFHVTRDIDPTILDEMIPRLILQPIVENAVEHDITARHGGKLHMHAYRSGGCVVLEVEHDGTMTEEDRESIRKLLSPEPSPKGQVGLKNVYRRLKLLYGQDGNLSVEETERGSILAKIVFPLA